MEKAFKYRIYPNKQQKILISKTFGCTRFVYNYYLTKRKEAFENESRTMGYYECCKDLTSLKKENEWLKESDKNAYQYALKHLSQAFVSFFTTPNRGYPKYKTKHSHRNSYTTTNGNHDTSIQVLDGKIKLPKLGYVKTKDRHILEGRIINATISQVPSGKYYVSICCTDVAQQPYPKTGRKLGLDLGLKDICISSDGEKYYNPQFISKSQRKLALLQRELSRKTRGGKNWNKARIKVARQYEKVSNQRRDYLQKLSSKLIKENDIICIEDLNILDMIASGTGSRKKQTNLHGKLYDAALREFRRELTYKANWYGREIIIVDRFFASSQTCSVCGCKNPITKNLSVRKWKCENCGSIHDRDINAAINIMQYA